MAGEVATRTGSSSPNGFVIAVVAVAVLGVALPEVGEAIRGTTGVLPALVALALFLSGLQVAPSDLGQPRSGIAIAIGLFATYGVAPALALGLAVGLAPAGDPRFVEGVLITAAQAGTLSSAPALVSIAGGNRSLALALTIASNVLTVVATPAILRLTLSASVSFPVGEMIGRMALWVCLPVAMGVLLGPAARRGGRFVDRVLRFGPQAIVLLFVWTGVASAGGALTDGPGLLVRLVLVSLALHAGLLGFTWAASLAAGLTPEQRTAVILCGSQKTLPNGMYVWGRFFPGNPYGGVAIVTYHVLQLVIDSWIASRLGRAEISSEG